MNTKFNSFFLSLGEGIWQAQRLEYDLTSLMLLLHRVENVFISIEDLLSFQLSLSRKTLGQLMDVLRKWINIGQIADAYLSEALSARNYLAHKVFTEDSDSLASEIGIAATLLKIKNARESVERADKLVQELVLTLSPMVGISPEEFSKERTRMLNDSN
jgi:hypothetical protein